jgi:formiminoglutamase
VVVIGGGNDQSYPNAAGLLDTCAPGTALGVVNIDAHLDVRPLKDGMVRRELFR